MPQSILLICKRVMFYSAFDEDAFFEWIKKIPAITAVNGVLDEIHLYVNDSNIDRTTFREMHGLFKRYKIDRKQLEVFMNKENEAWFRHYIKTK